MPLIALIRLLYRFRKLAALFVLAETLFKVGRGVQHRRATR